MNLKFNRFIVSGTRMVALAVVATSIAFVPVSAMAADKDAREDRAEHRISMLHSKLKITAEQETQWAQVAQVMRDDAKTMDALTQARKDHAKDMTAVDDIKSYGDIAAAHADGIKKLLPAFSALYSSMSDAQKKEADLLFRDGGRMHRHRHGHE